MKLSKPKPEDIEQCIKLVETDKPVFTEFVNKLSKTHASLTSSTIYVNGINKTIAKSKVRGGKDKPGKGNEPIKDNDNDENDLGKGEKWDLRILICQFWDYSISGEKENPNITYT